MFDYKVLLWICWILLTIWGYIPYIIDTIKGKTKPHIFSWFIWGLLTMIIFAIQSEHNAGFWAFVTLFTGISCFLIVWISLKKWGKNNITFWDKISLLWGIISLILWLFIDIPLYSVFLIILLDIFAFYPTIRKSWKSPHQETYILYFFAGIKFILTILALNDFSLINISYPLFWVLMNFWFLSMCFLRRHQLTTKK